MSEVAMFLLLLSSLLLTCALSGQSGGPTAYHPWLPHLGGVTAAIAAGDLDGDGDQDLVLGRRDAYSGLANRIFINDGKGAFKDESGHRLPWIEDHTRALALGDLDGDGDLDLVTGSAAGRNRLYANDGRGRFTEVTTGLPLIPGDTTAVALGDLDGDGDLDLVWGVDGSLRVMVNSGRGRFEDRTKQWLGETKRTGYVFWPDYLRVGVRRIIPADINGDGLLDIVACCCSPIHAWTRRSGWVKVYLNRGHEKLVPSPLVSRDLWSLPRKSSHTPPPGPRDIAMGDVDGDGDPDLLVAGRQGNALLLNQGGRGFRRASTARYASSAVRTSRLLLADLDGDGDLDLVEGNTGPGNLLGHDCTCGGSDRPQGESNLVYLNLGGGRFRRRDKHPAAPPGRTGCLAAADLDGDGDLDLVEGNMTGPDLIRFNQGKGCFKHHRAPALDGEGWCRERRGITREMLPFDVDGDGDLDCLVRCKKDLNRLFINDGKGRLAASPAGILAGRGVGKPPLNRVRYTWLPNLHLLPGSSPGRPDLVITFSSWLCRNQGRGEFEKQSLNRRVRNSLFCAGDVTGNGRQDYIAWGYDRPMIFLVGNPGSRMERRRDFLGPKPSCIGSGQPAAGAMALHDVDGDGDLDLVCGIWFAWETRMVRPPVSPGDRGCLEWITCSHNRIYLNDGKGRFSARELPGPDLPTSCLAWGDVDGDGDGDLVFGNGGPSFHAANTLWLNQGQGNFTRAGADRFPGGTGTTIGVHLRDLDGDGDLDLLEENAFDPCRLLLNDGQGHFTEAGANHLPAMPRAFRRLAPGDFDGDGDTDILVRYTGVDGERNLLLRNDGKGRFRE